MTDKNTFWSPFVHQLEPYIPGEQPVGDELIKLNTNESPYPPSPKALAAISAHADDNLRLYPDPESTELREVIAAYHSLASQQVFIGNGSDEVLAHAFNAFFRQPKTILFPDLTYSFYPVYCQLYQIDYDLVALNDRFEIDVKEYSRDNGGIIFPNPNAPTGIGLSRSAIISLLEQNPRSVVIVDEAYIDYAQKSEASLDSQSVTSVVDLTHQYNNLLVVHTLSKSRAFAGMRIGYAVGHIGLIEALQRVKNSFNSYPIDRLAQQAAIASFGDEDYFQSTVNKVIASRVRLVSCLEVLQFSCLPSAANFILVRHDLIDAPTLANFLRDKKIIVRYFSAPRVDQYIRITVGTDQQNQILLDAITYFLSA